jgi:O-antigen/teichoic acid export membrane protein
MAGVFLGEGAGPWLVSTLFGERFTESGDLLSAAMWLLIPWNCGSALWMVHLARGRFVFPSLSMGIGALVMTLSMPILLKTLGTMGAILAIGLGAALWALVLLLLVIRDEALNLGQAVWRPGAATLAALLIFFALTPAGLWIAVCGGWLTLFIASRVIGVITASDWHIVLTVLKGRSA